MSDPTKPSFSLPMAGGDSGQVDHGHSHEGAGHSGHGQAQTEILMQAILCGCLGLVGVFLYWGNKVEIILATKFHNWLLAGSITLIVLALARIVSVWRLTSTGNAIAGGCCNHADHQHDHESCNDPGHQHDHPHGAHGCEEHGHSHAYEPIKAVVLMIPVGLFLLNLPNSSFAAVQALDLNQVEISSSIADRGTENNVSFLQLERAAQRDEARQLYEGKTVALVGQFQGNDDKKFTLIRFKMNCCAADAVPLKGAMFVDPKAPAKIDHPRWNKKWVKVKGQVQFIKMKDGTFITALVLRPKDDNDLNGDWIQETIPDSIYLQN